MTTMEGDERLYRQQETPRGLAITSENGQKRRRKGSIMIRRGMPRIATTSTTAAGELLVACCTSVQVIKPTINSYSYRRLIVGVQGVLLASTEQEEMATPASLVPTRYAATMKDCNDSSSNCDG